MIDPILVNAEFPVTVDENIEEQEDTYIPEGIYNAAQLRFRQERDHGYIPYPYQRNVFHDREPVAVDLDDIVWHTPDTEEGQGLFDLTGIGMRDERIQVRPFDVTEHDHHREARDRAGAIEWIRRFLHDAHISTPMSAREIDMGLRLLNELDEGTPFRRRVTGRFYFANDDGRSETGMEVAIPITFETKDMGVIASTMYGKLVVVGENEEDAEEKLRRKVYDYFG